MTGRDCDSGAPTGGRRTDGESYGDGASCQPLEATEHRQGEDLGSSKAGGLVDESS
jgi:hypothetical protein